MTSFAGRIFLPVVVDILVKCPAHSYIVELHASANRKDRLLSSYRFLDQGQLEKVALKQVIVTDNFLFCSIKLRRDMLTTCDNQLINQGNIVLSRCWVSNRKDEGDAPRFLNPLDKACRCITEVHSLFFTKRALVARYPNHWFLHRSFSNLFIANIVPYFITLRR